MGADDYRRHPGKRGEGNRSFPLLPGLRYEIETDDPGDVPEWEQRYLDALRRLTDRMDQTTELIREGM